MLFGTLSAMLASAFTDFTASFGMTVASLPPIRLFYLMRLVVALPVVAYRGDLTAVSL